MFRSILKIALPCLIGFAFSQSPSSVMAGGACCSAGARFPLLVQGHDEGFLSLTMTGATVIGSSNPQGDVEFYHDEMSDRSLTTTLGLASRLSHQWQIAGSLPFVHKQASDHAVKTRASDFGDLSLYTTYEPVQGQVFVTGGLVAPTGESAFEQSVGDHRRATGKGFWTLQSSLIYVHKIAPWDLSAMTAVSYSFSRTFDRSQGPLTISPGVGLSGQLASGYQFADFRVGLALGPHWMQGQREQNSFGSLSRSYKLVWDVSADLAYSLSHTQTLAIMANDQTLLGPTQSTDLSRSVGFLWRWSWM